MNKCIYLENSEGLADFFNIIHIYMYIYTQMYTVLLQLKLHEPRKKVLLLSMGNPGCLIPGSLKVS